MAARRRGRKTLIILAGIFGVLGLAYALREPLFGRLLGRVAAGQLEKVLGGGFSVGKVRGSLFSDVVLEDVRTLAHPKGALEKLDVRRLEVKFRLVPLICGDLANAFEAIDASGVDAAVDLEHPKKPGPPSKRRGAGFRTVLEKIPYSLPRLRVAGTFRMHLAAGDIRVDEAVVEGERDEVRVSLHGMRAPRSFRLESEAELRANLSRPDAATVVWRSDDAVAGVRLRSGRLHADSDDAWDVQARLEVAGGDVDVVGDQDRATVTLTRIGVQELPKWLRALARPFEFPRRGTVGAVVTVTGWRTRAPAFEGSIDARELVAEWMEFDHLRAAGRWAGRRGRIGTVDLAGPEARIEVANADLDLDAPSIVTRADRVAVDVPDAGRMLRGFDLPEVAAWLPAARTALRVSVHGTSDAIEIERAAIESEPGSLEVRGRLLPPLDGNWRDARVDLDVGLRAEDIAAVFPLPLKRGALAGRPLAGAIDLRATVRGAAANPAVEASFEGRGLEFDRRRIAVAAGSASLAWPRLRVPELRAEGAEGTVRVTELEADLAAQEIAGARIVAEVPDARTLAGWLPPRLPRVAGHATLELDVASASRERLDARGRLVADGLDVDGLVIGSVRSDFEVHAPSVAIETLEMDGPLGRLHARARANLENPERSRGTAEFEIEVPEFETLSRWIPALRGVRGDVRVRGQVRKLAGLGMDAFSGTVAVEARNLERNGRPLGSLSLEARSDSESVWVDRLEVDTGVGHAVMSGRLETLSDGHRITLDTLDFESGGEHATLAAPATLAWSRSGFELGEVRLEGLGGSIRASGRLAGDLVADVTASGIDLARFHPDVAGTIALELHASGDPRSPEVSVRCDAPELSFRGQSGALAMTAFQRGAGLVLERLDARWEGLAAAHGSGSFPFRVGVEGLVPFGAEDARVDLEGEVQGSDAWRALGLSPRIDFPPVVFAVRGEGPALELTVDAGAVALRGEEGAVTLAGATRLTLRLEPETIRARLAAEREGALRLEAEGSTEGGADWRHPEQLGARILDLPLTAKISLEAPDLRPVRTLVPAITRIEGAARAAIAVSGTVGDPQLSGDVRTERVSFRTRGEMPGFENIDLHLVLDRKVIRFESFEATLGFAPIGLGGTITLREHATPVFDLAVDGTNVLLLRDEDLSLRANVEAKVTGPLEKLLAQGKVTVTDARYTKPIDLLARGAPTAEGAIQLFSLRRGPLSAMEFDLEVVAYDSFLVRNNLVRGTFSAELKLEGTGEAPQPEGKIYFRDTTVRLPFSRLTIDYGEIEFPPGAPFSPVVDVTAYTRMKGYDLTVHVSGAMPDVDVNVAGLPPLSQKEAILLLTTGATPEQLQREGMTRAALVRAGSLLGSELLEQFSDGDEDASDFFDRFTIELGRDVTNSGQETIEAELQLTKKFYLRGERDSYDDYNLGVMWRLRFR